MKGNDTMASTGDIWLQWFSCCFHQPQSPSRRRQRRHQRMRIDRSMIGNPTNFVHTGEYRFIFVAFLLSIILNFFLHLRKITGHIGSNDAELSTNHLSALQNQMQSKGGYDINSLRLQVKKLLFFYSIYRFINNFFRYRHADPIQTYYYVLLFTSYM